MLDKLNRMKSLSEIKAAGYIRTLLEVVEHMHSLNVVHQDLKLKNLVFSKPGLSGILKVIDVGDSIVVDEDTTYYRFAGTRTYMPPEIIRPRTGREMKKVCEYERKEGKMKSVRDYYDKSDHKGCDELHNS